METKRIVTTIVLLQVLIDIITSETALCLNSKNAVYECCQDYKNISGNCEACIGSWGRDCGNDCSYGYYGHGCRKRCKCGYRQICDPKNGCVADNQAIDRAECKNNKNAVYECCQDYKNISGNCEACIGSWGRDCGNDCSYGYYGHGCRKRCKCGYRQICDPKNGCVADNRK
eukprot:XP_011447054.1 PREDICTED: multiple epidermal growth factor-like domains protein 6 [Crassostrea gigas]